MITDLLVEKILVLKKYDGYSIMFLEKVFEVDRRILFRDVDRINDFLNKVKLEEFFFTDNKIVSPGWDKKELIKAISKFEENFLFQDERPLAIIIYIFIANSYISNYHFQDLFKMSKNTILNDIRISKEIAAEYNIRLKYSRSKGYHLIGNPINQRRLLEYAVTNILDLETGSWMIFFLTHKQVDSEVITKISKVLRESTDGIYVEKSLMRLSYILAILSISKFEPTDVFSSNQYHLLRGLDINNLTEGIVRFLPQLNDERFYIASRIMASLQGDLKRESTYFLQKKMDLIIEKVLGYLGIVNNNPQHFRVVFFNHFVPAYFRMVFGIYEHNPLKENVKSKYTDLYSIIKRVVIALEEKSDYTLSEDEIIYFVILFEGYIGTTKPINSQYKGIVVCPNGVSSSYILTKILRETLPEILIIDFYSMQEIYTLNKDTYDIIFTTRLIEDINKPQFEVSPVMKPVEESILKRKVYDYLGIHDSNLERVDEVLAILENHVTIPDYNVLQTELDTYFSEDINNLNNLQGGKNLNELLNSSRIKFVEKVADWREAITVASAPLLAQGFIEKQYITSMIESVEEFGPYIVLSPHVAVPHATPDKGVKRLGMSLLRLEDSVDFNLKEDKDDDKFVNLIFVLAPVDSKAHLKSLAQLANILDEENIIRKINEAKNPDEIMEIIDEEMEM